MKMVDEDCILQCKLKWFNESKGFGFVIPEGRPDQDAFVHVSALQKAGITHLGQDAVISCTIKETENGLFVERVVGLTEVGDLDIHKVKIPLPPDVGEVYELRGRVKWFRADKGYGFVAGHDGMKDVFIHQTCLRRNGLNEDDFKKGLAVLMMVRDVDQGREAVEIALLPIDGAAAEEDAGAGAECGAAANKSRN